MSLFGQYVTPDTPVYLVVYHTIGQSFTGFPVFEIIKVYACEFQDIDTLWKNHMDPAANYQIMAFHREVANPFQGQAVDTSDPFAADVPASNLWVPQKNKPLTPWDVVENMKLAPQPDDRDPFLSSDGPSAEEKSVWDI
jgi:hypothetical protein